MSHGIERRLLLKAATLGLGALSIPGMAAVSAARGFTHNVASGEPGHDRVMLWTRYVPAGGGAARLEAQVARTADFARIVARGEAEASPDGDHTAKVVVDGLSPGLWYYFRFRAPDGSVSPTGRTRTLPDGRVGKFTLGVFSCANLPFGWFNAYAHAAARQDIDLMVHLGDYFYEYERGKYPTAAAALTDRLIDPAGEVVALADYRMRHATYRADPDLQRLHQLFPMVMMWDDHESANNSWQGGAENHQAATEGAWDARKRAAMRAYREWMPVSEGGWESYQIGDLATLFRPETRLTARSRQFALDQEIAGAADRKAALIAFRDGPWRDPARTMLGAEQERWLADGLRRSARQGTRWQLLGQQVVMGSAALALESNEWMAADATPRSRQRTALGVDASSVGLPYNYDQWDGYPAARDRLLKSALDADANLIVLSGDSHNAWAFDLDLAGAAAGAEFAGHSVTSPGYEDYLPHIRPETIARASVARNPQLKWAETSRRGYLTLELTPNHATGEWLFLDTIRQRSTALAGRHRMSVRRGTNRLAAG